MTFGNRGTDLHNVKPLALVGIEVFFYPVPVSTNNL